MILIDWSLKPLNTPFKLFQRIHWFLRQKLLREKIIYVNIKYGYKPIIIVWLPNGRRIDFTQNNSEYFICALNCEIIKMFNIKQKEKICRFICTKLIAKNGVYSYLMSI